jgi:hypothetical protein
MTERHTIVGGWRLVAFENHDGDGRVRLPYGPAPVGYLLYTADGRMSATIMRGDRTPLAGEPRRGEGTAEKARAFEEYLSYAGRYTLLGERVIHHVEVSLWPGWVGTDLERWAEFRDQRLILRTVPNGDDARARTTIITWERVATT